MDDLDVLLAAGASRNVREYLGTMAGVSEGRALVDVEGERIPVFTFGPIPKLTDPVRVWIVDGKPYLMGVTYPQPTSGTVGAVGETTVQVVTDTGTLENVAVGTPTLPTSGAAVVLQWTDEGPIVVAALLAASEVVEPPPVPPGSEVVDTQLFPALTTGTWSDGGSRPWTADMYASATSIGGIGYGQKIRDTLTGATPLRLEIKLTPKRDSGNPPRIGTQPKEEISGGVPSVSNLWTMPRPVSGWLLLYDVDERTETLALVQTLMAGGGLGFDGSGYTIFQGLGRGDSEAGALKFTYKK